MLGFLQTIINLIETLTHTISSLFGYVVVGVINLYHLVSSYVTLGIVIPSPILWVLYLFFNAMLIRFIISLGRRG